MSEIRSDWKALYGFRPRAFAHFERSKARSAKMQKLAPVHGTQTVCIFTLLFTKKALQNGQRNTPSEAIRAFPLLG